MTPAIRYVVERSLVSLSKSIHRENEMGAAKRREHERMCAPDVFSLHSAIVINATRPIIGN